VRAGGGRNDLFSPEPAGRWDVDMVRSGHPDIPFHDRFWRLSSDMMCVADQRGVMLAVNPAWTAALGWDEDELAGTRLHRLVHPDDLAATEAELSSLAEGHGSPRFENRLRRKDGVYRHVSWRSALADGLIFAVGRDVTERLEQEEALRQSQKMEAVGQLAGGIAHDFNNLLTILRSSIEFLERPDTPEERRRRYIAAISSTVERAVKLTSHLLAFARRQKLEPEVFEVSEKIADVCQLLRPLIGDGVQISVQAPATPCHALADVCQFETALVNLAINARDAMQGRGRIDIGVDVVGVLPSVQNHGEGLGEFVAISVRDTGPGIPPELRDRVFEPFFTTKQVGHGTGLGLSQVYGFVKQSGGELDLQSESTGAAFTLYLPRTTNGAAKNAAAPAPSRAAPGGLRILIVEDNDEVGEFCLEFLRDLRHRPSLARNANEALAMIEEGEDAYDVVFSDVVMPGMSGLELADHLQRTRPKLPVLLASGYTPVLAQGRARGVRLIGKPYAPHELAAALQGVAGGVSRC
jgi:PAS domain S-box-containing protein